MKIDFNYILLSQAGVGRIENNFLDKLESNNSRSSLENEMQRIRAYVHTHTHTSIVVSRKVVITEKRNEGIKLKFASSLS